MTEAELAKNMLLNDTFYQHYIEYRENIRKLRKLRKLRNIDFSECTSSELAKMRANIIQIISNIKVLNHYHHEFKVNTEKMDIIARELNLELIKRGYEKSHNLSKKELRKIKAKNNKSYKRNKNK